MTFIFFDNKFFRKMKIVMKLKWDFLLEIWFFWFVPVKHRTFAYTSTLVRIKSSMVLPYYSSYENVCIYVDVRKCVRVCCYCVPFLFFSSFRSFHVVRPCPGFLFIVIIIVHVFLFLFFCIIILYTKENTINFG